MVATCISQTYSLSLRNQFYLNIPEQSIIYALAPLIYFTAIFNIVFFLRGKNRAEPPADILLFLCIFGIIRISAYLTQAIFDDKYPPAEGASVPSSFNNVCSTAGFLVVLCQVSGFVYNIVFSIYYVVKIKNPLQSWKKQNKGIHVFCLFVIVATTLIFFLTDLIGISVLGICGFKISGGIIYLDFFMAIAYFVVMVVSSIFFIKYLKSISKFDDQNKHYFEFYFKYLIIASTDHLIGLISLVVVTIKCLADSPDAILKVFSGICNISRLLGPVMVFTVMVYHPQAKFSSVLMCFSKIFRSKKQSQLDGDLDFYSDQTTTKRTSMMIQLNSLNRKGLQEIDYLSKIKDKNKACLINTILACISLQQNEYLQALESRKSALIIRKNSVRIEDIRLSNFQFQDDQQIFGWNYSQRYQFELTEEIIKAYCSIFNDKLPAINNLKFISYSSSLFKRLQKKQGINDLYKKMLPIRNQRVILDNVQTDGGRSGQFFFFNYDSSLIIKTITSNELRVLLERVEPYFTYFDRNPKSLIVKIFGLYKVTNPQTYEDISFMLMGNILKDIPKKYVLKSYDMKGSSHQRQVLKNQQLRQSGGVETRKTLKDIDFHTLQGRVHINKEDSNSLKKIIEQDTIFLYSQGLIDYSLILLKIDYKKMCQQTQIRGQGLKMYKSTKQEGVVYVLGIIDYLQTWNIRKRGEKWYKSIFSKIQGISSQDPRFYAQRFMKTLIHMILP